MIVYLWLASFVAITAQIGNIDNQFYVTFQEAMNMSQVQPSKIAEITLDGVRLASGVTVVLAQSLSFTGEIPAGKVTAPMLLQTIVGNKVPTDQFTLTYLRGNALKSLLEAYMASSVCSSLPDNGVFPQIAGAIFTHNVSRCEVTEIRICRRWVLSDPSCQEWTVLDPQEQIFLAVEVSMYANPVIAGIFQVNSAQNVSINLISGALRYFRQYNGTVVKQESFQDIISGVHQSGQTNSQMFALPIFILILVFINVIICCIKPKAVGKKETSPRKYDSGFKKDKGAGQPQVLNQEMSRRDMLDYMRFKNSEVEQLMQL